MIDRRSSAMQKTVHVIKVLSVTLAGAAIVAMALVMLAETTMRYVFTNPLGWNISAVERIFMPMSVFLALPWLYLTAGHVTAELVYDRLPASWRTGVRIIGHVFIIFIAAILTYGGMVTVLDSFSLGDAPPPGSSEIPIPTWLWQLSQPVGAAALLFVAVLDTPNVISDSHSHDADTLGGEEQ